MKAMVEAFCGDDTTVVELLETELTHADSVASGRFHDGVSDAAGGSVSRKARFDALSPVPLPPFGATALGYGRTLAQARARQADGLPRRRADPSVSPRDRCIFRLVRCVVFTVVVLMGAAALVYFTWEGRNVPLRDVMVWRGQLRAVPTETEAAGGGGQQQRQRLTIVGDGAQPESWRRAVRDDAHCLIFSPIDAQGAALEQLTELEFCDNEDGRLGVSFGTESALSFGYLSKRRWQFKVVILPESLAIEDLENVFAAALLDELVKAKRRSARIYILGSFGFRFHGALLQDRAGGRVWDQQKARFVEFEPTGTVEGMVTLMTAVIVIITITMLRWFGRGVLSEWHEHMDNWTAQYDVLWACPELHAPSVRCPEPQQGVAAARAFQLPESKVRFVDACRRFWQRIQASPPMFIIDNVVGSMHKNEEALRGAVASSFIGAVCLLSLLALPALWFYFLGSNRVLFLSLLCLHCCSGIFFQCLYFISTPGRGRTVYLCLHLLTIALCFSFSVLHFVGIMTYMLMRALVSPMEVLGLAIPAYTVTFYVFLMWLQLRKMQRNLRRESKMSSGRFAEYARYVGVTNSSIVFSIATSATTMVLLTILLVVVHDFSRDRTLRGDFDVVLSSRVIIPIFSIAHFAYKTFNSKAFVEERLNDKDAQEIAVAATEIAEEEWSD